MRARRLSPALVLVLALVSACTVGPDYRPPQPQVPAQWTQRGGMLTSEPADLAAWWRTFHDPQLNSLVSRAAASNLELRAAALRIAQARAQRDIATSGAWPSLNASGAYARTRISERTATTSLLGLGQSTGASPSGGVGGSIPGLANPFDQFQYGFDAAWEADLFGRVSRSVEAADAGVQASVEERHDAFVSLAGEVARAYIELRSAQREQLIARDSLQTQRGILELAQQRRDAGVGDDLDVANAAAVAAGTQAQLPLYQRRITQAVNQLSLLLAQQPGALSEELEAVQAVPPVPPRMPAGLPADLVRRRPDIRAAEARLHAATAQVGVATADFFPDLTLHLGLGLQAERVKDLTDWASHFMSLGPSLELPVFDGGRRRATVRLQGLRAQEAAVGYAGAVLDALHEVDNAAAACDAEQERQAALAAAVSQEQTALQLAQQRYQSGIAGFIEVLDAERSQQQAQLAQADSAAAAADSFVALYKALGGGWEEADIEARRE